MSDQQQDYQGYCNKCGYSGKCEPDGQHYRPNGTRCGYMAHRLKPADQQQESLRIAERIAGEAELEVMAFRSQDPEALDRLNAAMVKLRDDISAALTAARQVPPGHVRGSDGVDRKVLGTLPTTADGCVLGANAPFWTDDDYESWKHKKRVFREWSTTPSMAGEDGGYDGCFHFDLTLDKCYSSHEAAQRSKSE